MFLFFFFDGAGSTGVYTSLFVGSVNVYKRQSAESTGTDNHVEAELGGFIEVVVEGITTGGMELSGTKCVATASSRSLGKRLQERWKKAGLYIPYNKGVRSLGAGLGAGVCRNVKVIKARLEGLAARAPRFRWLRNLGIDAAMLIRTGGKEAMTYGAAILGVSNSLLRDQRRIG